MSKLGFDKVMMEMNGVERVFLKKGMKISMNHFEKNFDTESNTATGNEWNDVVRDVPPPILNVTGKLKEESTNERNVEYSGNKATLTVDPIDKRGKGYAEYHEEGINQYRSKSDFQREFITEGQDMMDEIEVMLINELDKVFK